MARPKAKIDFTIVDNYLHAQCDGASIAGLFKIHPDTLYNHIKEKFGMSFSAYQEQKRSEGKEILRMKLWKIALQGNVTMLIWLSKNYLGMSDKNSLDLTTDLSTLTEDQLNYIANKLLKNNGKND